MASNMFMKIAGVADSDFKDTTVDGKPFPDSAKGWYPISGWSWGATNSSGHISTEKAAGGQTEVHDLTITHDLGYCGTDRISMCAKGHPIASLEVMCRKPNGSKYFYVKVEQCVVSAADCSGHSKEGDHDLAHTFSVHFNKIDLKNIADKTNTASWSRAK